MQQASKSWGEKLLSLFIACVGVEQLIPYLLPFKLSLKNKKENKKI